jgi:hypothetical protein
MNKCNAAFAIKGFENVRIGALIDDYPEIFVFRND